MKVKILLAVVMCFAGQVLRLGSGQALAQDSSNVRSIGYYDTPGSAYGVAVDSNYAYVADVDSGLRVLDISNLSNPIEVGNLNTLKPAHRLSVVGSFAYLAESDSILQIVDITDPANPFEAGHYKTPSQALGIAVSGNYAWVLYRKYMI